MEGKLCVRELTVGQLGTCCYLVWREGADSCVVIDPGAEPERIREAAQGKSIAAILLTHGHFDHIGAVNALKDADTDLVIHRLDVSMLQDPERNVSWMIGQTITAPEANVAVQDGDKLTYAGVTFTVLHTPGHTPGSVCLRFGDDLFCGDTLFAGSCGRTDFPGGSPAQMLESLRRLSDLPDAIHAYPGHGNSTTLAREKRYNPYMTE